MSLGSFLGAAGRAAPAYDRGIAEAFAFQDAERQRAEQNRARDAAARDTGDLDVLGTKIATVPQNVGEPDPGKLALLAGVKVPAPPKPPAPTAGGEQPPPTTVAAPATTAAPPTTVPTGSPIAGVTLPADVNRANAPGYYAANSEAWQQAAAGPAPAGYQPPPGAPGTAPLTRRQAEQFNAWLVSPDARTYFTNNQAEQAKLLRDPEKWARDVFIPGKAPGLFPGQKADPLNYVPILQKNSNPIAAEKPGIWEQIGRGIVGGQTGIDPMANAGANPNQAKIDALIQTQRALGTSLGTVSKEVMARATLAAAPNVTTAPQKATDVVPTPTAPMSAGAAIEVAQNKAPSNHYLAEPQTITPDTQRALYMRDYLVKRIHSLARVGTAEAATAMRELIPKIGDIDNSVAHMQGMKAIQELSTLHDPRRMEGVMSYQTGAPIRIQPRSDGTYNISRGDTGEIAAEGITLADLIDRGRSMFDGEYVTRRDASAATQAEKLQEHVFKMDEGAQKGMIDYGLARVKSADDFAQAMAVAHANNQGQMAIQIYKSTHPDANVQMAADGSSVITLPTGEIISYNPTPGTIEIDGKTVNLPPKQTIIPAGGAGVNTSGTFPAGQL